MFSHYLYGVDNGIGEQAAVTAQSNKDSKVWNTYDDWKPRPAFTQTGESARKRPRHHTIMHAIGVNKDNWKGVHGGSTASSAMYTMM